MRCKTLNNLYELNSLQCRSMRSMTYAISVQNQYRSYMNIHVHTINCHNNGKLPTKAENDISSDESAKKVFRLCLLNGYRISSFNSIMQVRIFRESKCRESTVRDFSNNYTCFSNSRQLECRSGYKPRGYKLNLN